MTPPQNKKFYSIFSCEGYPPPVCLRCSPGLFRHSCGAVSCHTSSMAANPQLALTKNSSPTTLANGRRAAQNRGVQGQRPRSPVATGEIPAGRSQRNTCAAHGAKFPIVPKRHPQMAQAPRRSRKAAVPTPSGVADGGLLAYLLLMTSKLQPTGRLQLTYNSLAGSIPSFPAAS